MLNQAFGKMGYSFKSFICVISFCITCVSLYSQTDALKRTQVNSSGSAKEYWQEKVYVHLDRDFYLTGETVWFKVYIASVGDNKMNTISNVAYVELLNSSNHPVAQIKIHIKNGTGDGSLYVPSSLSSGYYRLRSYTNWMKNFSSASFFSRDIKVINVFKQFDYEPAQEEASAISAKFFPEGGKLISDLENKVGYQVTDEFDNGINFSGVVMANGTDIVTKFSPHKFGIGSFQFTPKSNVNYEAIITSEQGVSKRFAIGTAQEGGYSLKVLEHGNDLDIRVSCSQLLENNEVRLAIYGRNSKVINQLQSAHNREVIFTMPIAQLQEGVSQIVIYSSNQAPVCKRLYYKMPVDSSFKIGLTKKEYHTREKIDLRLPAKLAGSFSVAVLKLDSLSSYNQLSAYSYFWLSSALNTPIENPEYYFSAYNEEVKQAHDNLMLVHETGDFQQQLSSGLNQKEFVPEMQGQQVKLISNSPSSSQNVSLTVLGYDPKLYVNKKQGTDVNFELFNEWGSKQIVILPWKDSSTVFRLSPPYSDSFSPIPFPELRLNPNIRNSLQRRSVSMQLHDIFHEKELNTNVKIENDSIPFYGRPDATYKLDDYTRFPDMEEVFREYVKGVALRKSNDHYKLYIKYILNKPSSKRNPLILVDNVPVTSVDDIIKMDPLKVKSIGVVSKEYLLGDVTFEGIISIRTYQGDMGGVPLPRHSLVLNWDGFQIKKKFYSPDYEKKSSHRPDMRYLLLWKPDISLEKGHEAKPITFFSSDVQGTFEIVIEGIADNGRPIHLTQTIEIKNQF